ncbi:glycoside hydrolase family 2 TIM barrel-domain containing protein [Polaribacter sp.]|uniref:glycoside hydrolase family 2 protein n=1 Tax=Polaribacter sp. TaxID=1920175 RepID=UPI0025F4CF67|nr:glycoside hydrolase family 2 TIM barrel-domain containing protein [Polaribacter sp.]
MKTLNFFFNKIVIAFILLCMISSGNHAQEKITLTNNWKFLQSDLGGIWEAVRPIKRGNAEAVPFWETVSIPHSYNAQDAVDPDVNYYQGPAWYKTNIKTNNPYPDGRTLIHFEGVGQRAEVYLYTEKVGEHIGGYDEWTIDITEAIKKIKKLPNSKKRFRKGIPLIVRSDNSRDLTTIPSNLSDFTVYGGIYRQVHLVHVPNIYMKDVVTGVTYDEKTKKGNIAISANVRNTQNSDYGLNVIIRNKKTKKEVARKNITSKNQNIDFNVTVKKPTLWNPDSPELYECIVTINSEKGTQKISRSVGFRYFEFKNKGPFLLNGKRLLLRGTHRHEDHAVVGAAMTPEMIEKEMVMMKEMGVNFIRLGHYQQSAQVLDLCDSLGIVVWEEIPWCRGGLGGEKYQAQAKRMLTNMIHQHKHHPSIIIWGLGNENDWDGDFQEFDKEKIRKFMKELHDLSHELDSERKTAIRRCDFCKDIVDVYSPSLWAGWYRGKFTEYANVSKQEANEVKHFLHVEWGASQHAGRHSESSEKVLDKIKTNQGADERDGDASLFGGVARVSKDGDWTETYGCDLIDWHLKEQEKMDWLTGTAYWPFKDFSTPVRPDNPVPYVNQKGVVQRDFKPKEAFYVFQSYWTEKPMVHIYGHSWPVRWGNVGEKKTVKVYSNCDKVELFVNGISYDFKKRNSQDFPAAGLRWNVELKEGDNIIIAKGKKGRFTISDTIHVKYQTAKWEKPSNAQVKVTPINKKESKVEVWLKDKNNVLCLDAKNWVLFDYIGKGKMLDNIGTTGGSRKVQATNGYASIIIQHNGGSGVVSVTSPKQVFTTVFKEINR